MFAIISTTLFYASVILPIYAKQYCHLLAVREGSTHARNCVYLDKSSYQQELLFHPMPQHVDKWSSLDRIKLRQYFPGTGERREPSKGRRVENFVLPRMPVCGINVYNYMPYVHNSGVH